MSLNKRKKSLVEREGHLNHEGGISFNPKDPFTVLRIAATSCFFGEPSFYEPSKPVRRSYGYDSGQYGSPLIDTSGGARQMLEKAIDDALNVSVERTLKFAVELRNEWYIRATPQVIMVRAAMHPKAAGTNLIRRYGRSIMSRLDEVMSQMAYFESVQGSLKRIPSRLKRAWADRLSQASEYELAKYKMTSRGINVYDAVNLTHANSGPIDHLMNDKLSLQNEGLRTWESIRSNGGSWAEALPVMGHMALLRNLRNLEQNGEITKEVLQKLIDGVEKGKQFPYRYYSALKAVGDRNAKLVDAIEECFENSIRFNCPRFKGKGLCIADVSGSMSATLSSNSSIAFEEISRLMSVVTAKAHEDGGDVMLFATGNKTFGIRQKSAVFDEMRRISGNHGCGHGTDIDQALRQAIRAGTKYDVIWIYSDMQCANMRGVPAMVKEYRQKVKSDTQFFFVNLAGYQDTLVPEFYDGTYLIGGWSDKVLQFADKIIGITR